MKLFWLSVLFLAATVAVLSVCLSRRSVVTAAEPLDAGATRMPSPRTVADVSRYCGAKTRKRYAPVCQAEGVAYPPSRVRLVAFKSERVLEIWGANRSGVYRQLASYPILAASGTVGAKRREGDFQVPEGFYRLTTLNPNSRFHVSVRVDYPNADDRAANPGVSVRELGGDIYIHGNRKSIGCLAMGDAAIEEIFCLVAQADKNDRTVWISLVDPRTSPMPKTDDANLAARYTKLATAIHALKK